MVIWVIGLSGSGKSFYAKKIEEAILKKKNKKVIILDGDEIRKYLTSNLRYSLKDRKKNSIYIQNLCKFLEFKGFVVICSILSIFRSHQKRNRKIFNKYIQIFLDVPIEKLFIRNKKNIYLKKNVVGKKIKFNKPYKSDLVFMNKFGNDYKNNIDKIIKFINER